MCTLALYFKAFNEFPLVIAANRDEHYDRPSAAPALLDGDPAGDPAIVAGRDLRVGGTWMGINDHGLFVGILNRRTNGAADPQAPPRSRGLLCMDLLKTRSAFAARASIQAQRKRYQPFTAVFADADCAWAAYNTQDRIELIELPPGLHVFSSAAEVDLRSEKADRAYRQFAQLLDDPQDVSKVRTLALGKLQTLLSDHKALGSGGGAREAICVHGEVSGTVSASVVFLSETRRRFQLFHCPGPPCQNGFGEAFTLPVR